MRKLKEEREKQAAMEEKRRTARNKWEKQAAMEEKRRTAWNKRKLKGRPHAASDSGGESTRGPTPAGAGQHKPEPTGRPAATSGPGRSGIPPRGAARPELIELGAEPRWQEERWRRERGMEHLDGWERTWGGPVRAEDRRPPGKRWGDRRGPSPDPRERRRWLGRAEAEYTVIV